jgi:hypothetical protein
LRGLSPYNGLFLPSGVLRLTAGQAVVRPGTGGRAVLVWNNGILEFWNDGIRKKHPKKGFDQFSRNIPLFQHSNIPICNMH